MRKDVIAAIELRAAQQYSLFTYDEAIALGVTATMLHHHSRPGGRWGRPAPRVYEVVGGPPDWRRPLLASLLSAGPNAAGSHRSAGCLLCLDGVRPGRPELILLDGTAGFGWRPHRRAVLPPDVMTTDGIPHTTPLRTLRDLCSVLDDDHMEMAVESALRLGIVTLADLERMAAVKGWKGVRRLRRVLARRPVGAAPTGSELETRFVQLVRSAGLPDPQRQYPVARNGDVVARLDLCWPDRRLFVELDGREHELPAALLRDRQRQNDVVRILGWRPLRYTWGDVVNRPATSARTAHAAFSNTLAV